MRIVLTNSGLEVMSSIEVKKPNKVKENKEQINKSSLILPEISPVSQKVKVIKVGKRKLNLPKQVLDKYNINYSNNNDQTNILVSNESPLRKNRQSVSLNNIFSANTIEEYKKSLELNISNKLVEDTTILRSSNNKPLDKNLKVLFDKEIDIDKTNLINYLKNQEHISPITLKNLSQSSENRLYKLNKMCDKIYKNQENERILQLNIANKIAENNSKKSQIYRDGLEFMHNKLTKINDILNDSMNRLIKVNYSKIHDNILKVWEKNNVDRFYKKKSKPKKLIFNRESICSLDSLALRELGK